MLECSGLDFFYGQKKRLDGISFSFGQGIFGLFGRNGSGKSTLLKILGGSLPAQHGLIKFHGQNALGPRRYIIDSFRKNFGILFQETSSDEKLSAQDNLFYSAILMGIDKAKAVLTTKRMLDQIGLSEWADKPVKKLSGGMRRRLELYRTFLHEPRVLLLDEPTSGLDVSEACRFFRFLKEYQEKNSALVLISSHSPEELSICERVLFMAEGSILADGSPKSLQSREDYLCLTLKLKGEAMDIDPASLNLFDAFYDEKSAILKGKIKAHDLSSLLSERSFFMGPLFEGFRVDKPNLADAYASLLKSFVHGGIDGAHL